MPLFPQQAGAFYSARYEVDGRRVTVYYSDRELSVPAFSDSETCGEYTLGHIEDPDFTVRYLNIEDEHIFFTWDDTAGEQRSESSDSQRESESDVDLCAYVPSFSERYEFFATSFPSEMSSRLPAVITTE
ncbi:MAG: hypothetical protein ACLFM0_11140 [Spirochaetales bacterium]